MKMNNAVLKNYYFGAYEFGETEDGYLQAFQYSKPQIDYFKRVEQYWYDRCTASTAKTLEFITQSTEFSFEYRIIWQGSFDTFELFADGECVAVYRVEELAKEGTLKFHIPGEMQKRHVIIYLPVDATVLIRNFICNGSVQPPVKTKKVLMLGDSITQGFGPLRSSGTFVSVANRELNFDILNQGIAGYVYDKGSLMKMGDYNPDWIIVALGTNQYFAKSIKPVESYYERLFEIYGNDIPTLVITPVWRNDFENEKERETFFTFCNAIKAICKRYRNITVIDGFDLVPHSEEYYIDSLHPNEKGAALYGHNLADFIRNLQDK